jgi:hypothetical protein
MDIVFGRTGGKEEVLVRFFLYLIRILWFGGRSTLSLSANSHHQKIKGIFGGIDVVPLAVDKGVAEHFSSIFISNLGSCRKKMFFELKWKFFQKSCWLRPWPRGKGSPPLKKIVN